MLVRVLFIMLLSVSVVACSSKDKNLGDSSGAVLSERDGVGYPDGSGFDGSSVGGVDGSVVPGSAQDFAINAGDRILFDTNSYSLNSEARMIAESQARWLNNYSSLNVTIEGHADERGTREYNLALGESRANAIKNYLVSLGVDPRRLNTISYGKEQPAVIGDGPSAWSQNRRGMTRIQ